MIERYNGKTVLISGAGSGIGRQISRRLAAEGANTLILDINQSAAEQTVDEIRASNGSAHAYACDVSLHNDARQVVEDIIGDQPIDCLINNAGIAHIGTVESTSEAELDRLYSVNVKGLYNLTAAVIPSMKTRNSGVLLNIASIASSVGIENRFAYSMTKGAVLAMTYSIARDYLAYGIRCNCISPARIHTPFVDNYLDANYPDSRDEMFEALSRSQPIGRMGTADEVASLVAYLCSDEAAFITGSNVPIDGGFTTLNN